MTGGTAGRGRPRRGTGARSAYAEIRGRILSLELEPGQNVDEQDFVEALGLSRTPVREALIQLAAEGLVELLPNRGARVAPVDLSTVREFLEALDANQRMVTRWAAIRRSPADLSAIDRARLAFEAAADARDADGMLETNLAFHGAIADACGNGLVAKHYRQLLAFGLRLSRISLAHEPVAGRDRDEHLERIVGEHAAMLRHIADADADAAEAVARAHTETFRKRLLEYLSTNLAEPMTLA